MRNPTYWYHNLFSKCLRLSTLWSQNIVYIIYIDWSSPCTTSFFCLTRRRLSLRPSNPIYMVSSRIRFVCEATHPVLIEFRTRCKSGSDAIRSNERMQIVFRRSVPQRRWEGRSRTHANAGDCIWWRNGEMGSGKRMWTPNQVQRHIERTDWIKE